MAILSVYFSIFDHSAVLSVVELHIESKYSSIVRSVGIQVSLSSRLQAPLLRRSYETYGKEGRDVETEPGSTFVGVPPGTLPWQ